MKSTVAIRVLLALWIVVVLPSLGLGQGFGPLLSTVGTTIEDGQARDWNYLLWQFSEPNPFPNGHVAVYRKSGDANSGAPYERRAIVQRQVEGPTVQSLISRSWNLGDDPIDLENTVDALFQEMMPANVLTISDKVSAAIRGAVNDPAHWDNLLLLARSHPSIAMCLGVAFGEVVPASSVYTYELRQWDAANGVDLQVIGRVTVQAGNPVVLPAPGAPVVVPEENARGHLNVKVRWSTPDGLRRLSPMQFGYNLIRMTREYAESENFDVTPPTPEQIDELLPSVPEVVQVNRMPVLIPRDFTQGEVIDFSPVTGFPGEYFTHDDNRRFDDGGVPFLNGEEFYYFVAARDILGRYGEVSAGTYTLICDRMPPPTPRRVVVSNVYQNEAGTFMQRLKVEWAQNDNSGAEQTTRYHVYRWDSPGDMNAFAGNPANNLIAIVNHQNGTEKNTYIDEGAGAPTVASDAGRTFFYTVRAEDAGACGGNLSGNSAPKWGVLRDRQGPDAPGGRIDGICLVPEVEQTRVEYFGRNPNGGLVYTLRCTRLDPRIEWVEFYRGAVADASTRLGRRYYLNGSSYLDEIVQLPSTAGAEGLIFFCRVGTSFGKTSNIIIANNPGGTPNGSEIRLIHFEAGLRQVFSSSAKECDEFIYPLGPVGGGGVFPIFPITGTLLLTPETESYRVYRRVDGGELTLVEQGEADFDDVQFIEFDDPNIPANHSEICYYGQLFDEHGNASPLRLIECVEVSGTQPLPVPMLSNTAAEGDETSPTMRIRWFSPPHGVEQFELWLGSESWTLPVKIGDNISTNLVQSPNTVQLIESGVTNEYDFAVHRTTRVGGAALGGGPEFSLLVDAELGRDYTIMVRAVSPSGTVSEFSNVGKFVWRPETVEGPKVPWPARGLPLVNTNFSNAIIAGIDPGIYDGPLIRIGHFLTTQGNIKRPYFIPNTQLRPLDWIYTEQGSDKKLFPVVMYRYQIANANFPNVSGDLVQVSPLMEDIAIVVEQEGVRFHDSFIYLRGTQLTDDFALAEMFIADTHPWLRGARYGYLLVRLGENGEIDQVIRTPDVEVAP